MDGLTRSFENLEELKSKIENILIPQMIDEAKLLDCDLSQKSEEELAEEIIKRKSIVDKWKKIYWDEFIPFAHGIRIFGQFYNDKIKPIDPYEFVSLLQSTQMLSLERNRLLTKITKIITKDSSLVSFLKKGIWPEFDKELINLKEKFQSDFGNFEVSIDDSSEINDKILCNTILEMSAEKINSDEKTSVSDKLENVFLAHFTGKEKENAKSYLELGRCSYRQRDDDNIYLGRIEEQLSRAVSIGKTLINNGSENFKLKDALINITENIPIHTTTEYIEKGDNESDNQIVGQPSSPGLVTGKARVIFCNEDLKDFAKGEILVCDAIDPKMTFIAPLASGIVERRGGMLIHGAIIAREYGIACVTGIPNATDRIRTGDTVTVDGYLGIVTLGEPSDFFRKSKGMK